MQPKLIFKSLSSVSNPRSIHGIYPYRGKISAIDAQQVISQLPVNGTLLDPFCGSGTIIYEAYKHGLNVVGVDTNPIAIQIAKGKFDMVDLDNSLRKIHGLETKAKNVNLVIPKAFLKYFHVKTAKEILLAKQEYPTFTDYEKAVFLGSVCLSARGCNGYLWSSTQIGKIAKEKKYINFFDKFRDKLVKHSFPLDKSRTVRIYEQDSRRLSSILDTGSIDFVYTSPPYFDALDYTSNYTRIIHHLFDTDLSELKKKLIQRFDSYEKDIKDCFSEIIKITNEKAIIIFVVGDKKNGLETINGGNFFSSISDFKPNFVVEREYTKTASKIWDRINRTQRKEQIIVWDKSTWG